MAYRDESKYRHLAPQYDAGFLDGLDQRTRLHRELSARIEQVIADQGGEEHMAYTRMALIRHFIFLDATLDAMAVQMATYGTADLLGKYSVAFNTLVSVAKTLGIDRIAKETTLTEYLQAKRDDEPAEDSEQ